MVNLTINEMSSANKKPTLCLNMIVKNEAAVIGETLNNLTQKIQFDYWVISDTGSTDNTQQIISDYFLEKGIPGELFSHEWQDFGFNRTKALECAYDKTDYLLIFDADDKLHGDFKLPFDTTLRADRYMLKFGKGFEYMRPLLINNRKRWAFKGVLHEFLENLEPVNADINVLGDYHIESGRTGNRSQNPHKYRDDAIILKNAYEKELALPDKGLSGRYAFYCARSYKDAGEAYLDDAIAWYKKVLDTPHHWAQEKYYSALEIGIIYKQKNQMEEAVRYLLKTIEYDDERIEGLIMAIEYFSQTNQHILVNALYHRFKHYKQNLETKLASKLFVNKYFYTDRLEFFNAISAYYVNDKSSGYECSKQVLLNKTLGQHEINIIINNIAFYKEAAALDKDSLLLFYCIDDLLYKNNELIYNTKVSDLWTTLFDKNRSRLCAFNKTVAKTCNVNKNALVNANNTTNKKDKIIITFTTCKRLDLFKETINSMMNQWLDLDKITHWFCVDDNSSKEDRKAMRLTYPWIDYYMKTPSEIGHRMSMNIIWNKLNDLKPEYWIHMEDDFLFYHPFNYIGESIAALKHKACVSAGIKQIVFNRNYAETIDNYKTKGHIPMAAVPGIALHDHKPNQTITQYQNSQYWPYYSFRPSLTEVKAILKIGNYDSPNKFFERDYADKWTKANYKTAFIDRITHRHIGRLTSEINAGTVKNAYQLNGEEQFTSIPAVIHPIKSYIKLLNLLRRPDRKEKMVTLFEEAGIINYSVFKAIDGNDLEPLREFKHLFEGNDFGSRRGVIGCALSHLKMWRELLEDVNNDYYIIFEDDFSLGANFKERFAELKEKEEFNKNELLFLGYHMFEEKRASVKATYNIDISNTVINVKPLNKDLYIGGTFSYSINKVGAKKLVDYIEKNGIKHGIDYVMKIIPGVNSWELQPQMVYSDWNEAGNGKNIDTDIQTNYNSLDFSKTVEDQFIFIPMQDQIGDDIYFDRDLSLTDKMVKAIKDDKCVAFNTLGFFKSKVDKLTGSPYFGEKDGIYVKRGWGSDPLTPRGSAPLTPLELNSARGSAPLTPIELNSARGGKGMRSGTIPLKMSCNWCSSEQLCKEWSIMKPPHSRIDLVATAEDINTITVIINSPQPSDTYEPKRTVIFQMEPWIEDPSKNWGVKTWGEWAEPDPRKFLKVFTHKTHLNNVQWQIDYPFYTQPIDNQSKLNKVASIVSQKNFDTGHQLRNAFIKYVEEFKSLYPVDVYGRENYHLLLNYQGAIKDDNKFNVYSKYKYCFCAENNWIWNYATEKIWEPILCESLCFYWGCPNLEEYIDPRAFVRLPLEDPATALKIIHQAIEEDWWSQRIEIIKQMKEKILTHLGFYPLMERLLIKNSQLEC